MTMTKNDEEDDDDDNEERGEQWRKGGVGWVKFWVWKSIYSTVSIKIFEICFYLLEKTRNLIQYSTYIRDNLLKYYTVGIRTVYARTVYLATI
jgi:hypothetical protein